MFTIDITLKGMGIALSVQRKEEAAAQALYEQILQALKQGGGEIVELTCDRQPEKKIAVLSSEISAVQVSDKSGAATSRAAGFWGQLTQ